MNTNEDDEKCKCGAEPGDDPCPFALEIDGKEEYCNCCDYCREQCALDI